MGSANIIDKTIFRKGDINMENTNEVKVVEEKKSLGKKIVDGAKAHPIITGTFIAVVIGGVVYLVHKALTPSAIDIETSVDLTDANANIDSDDCMKVIDEDGNVLGDVVDMDGYSVTMAPTPSIDLEPSTDIVPAVTEVN